MIAGLRFVRPMFTVGCVIALAAAARAHELWIEPSTFHPNVNEAIDVRIRVGEHFKGEPVKRDGARIERLSLIGPGGERPVVGKEGADPIGITRANQPGTWFLCYVSRPAHLELEPAKFEAYLKAEGLEKILADRVARGESDKPGREDFSRSVKSILVAGEGSTEGFDRPIGLPLEIVPQQNPFDLSAGGQLTVQVLLDGKPLPDARVECVLASQGEHDHSHASDARTDSEGKATFTLAHAGMWMVSTVHMKRADADSGAEWRSTWSTLTFEVSSSAGKAALSGEGK